MSLRIGIAGFGVVGKRRREFINLRDDMGVVAVCDRIFDGQGVLEDGAKIFSGYHELLNQDLDALFVCISNDMAAEITVAGLEKGLHVFCEKPPGRDLDDMAWVIASEKSHPGLKLKYGFNHRYHNSVKDALAIVASGEMGKVINLRGMYGKSQLVTFGKDHDWRTSRKFAGGGILLDQGIHMVDLIRLFGGEFEDIHSFVSNDYWNHDVEDNAYALMRTSDGVVAMLHSSATQWRHRFNLEIMLEKGMLILSGILSGSKSYGKETLTIARRTGDDRGDPKEEIKNYDHDPSWADEISEFANGILNGQAIISGTSSEAFKTMQLVYSIYCADAEWQAKWGLASAATTT
jgi:predicted dehydrogenase